MHTPEYGPQDFLNVNRPLPNLIPQGAFTSKAIVKKDDVARIGQFKELYDNPLRPKLLEVEHPPDETTEKSLVQSNVAFFGELEPEASQIDPDTELLEVFNDISDDENEDDGAVFSDDEEETKMSDTNSVVVISDLDECDNNFDEDEVLDSAYEEKLREYLEKVEGDPETCGKDSEKEQENHLPIEQEPHPVPPIRRLEAEMTKNFNKTPLEMDDEELDFDDDEIE